jgi:methionyl-tRNA formyltransferase
MKLGVIASQWFGIPCLQALRARDALAGFGLPEKVHDGTIRLRMYAEQTGLAFTVFPKSSLEESLRAWLLENHPLAVLVFGFSYRLPASILEIPQFGFLNFHFGLLPEYRGPAPIFWTIREGADFGGITVHRMDASFDTGPIAHVERVPIVTGDTYGTHLAALAQAAPTAMELILSKIASSEGRLVFTPQDPSKARYLKRQELKDILIDWKSMSASAIHCLVRACNPQGGGAATMFRRTPLRVHQIAVREISSNPSGLVPGQFIENSLGNGPLVFTADRKAIELEVASTEAGIFSGFQFARLYQPRTGELLESVQ